MGLGEFLAFAVLVGGIIAVVRTASEVYQRKLGLREREIELALQNGASRSDGAAAATIEKLEARVRVLERIATDADAKLGRDVARQIEALRDQPVLEETK